jgi:hypothetical protein
MIYDVAYSSYPVNFGSLTLRPRTFRSLMITTTQTWQPKRFWPRDICTQKWTDCPSIQYWDTATPKSRSSCYKLHKDPSELWPAQSLWHYVPEFYHGLVALFNDLLGCWLFYYYFALLKCFVCKFKYLFGHFWSALLKEYLLMNQVSWEVAAVEITENIFGHCWIYSSFPALITQEFLKMHFQKNFNANFRPFFTSQWKEKWFCHSQQPAPNVVGFLHQFDVSIFRPELPKS